MNCNTRKIPEELLYDTHYQWIKQAGSKITFGLTAYGLEITGDVLYIALSAEGTPVEGGGACGSLEAGKWVGRVYAPVSGKITNVNKTVLACPALISKDPYSCWFAEIELSRSGELADLMSATTFRVWLSETEDLQANA